MEEIHNKIAEISEYLPKDKSGAPIVPINLSIILNKFNLKAYDVEFKRPDVSGAFDRSAKEIYLNSTDPQSRKLFTLAHELGHYFLHSSVESDVLFRERTDHKEKKEKEADQFAAELLMPESSIRAYWPIAESIQQLADIFSVSYLAMKTRLQYLGFI